MDELVKLVTEKAGISEDMARTAIETVLGYLKDKLPAPIAGQLDGIVKGSGAADLGDLAKGVGNLFG